MTLPITAPVTLTPLTLWLPLWAGPPQDRQLFDTISLLIQGSLDGELKLMDELAGPGGQPSAFPTARSPGGSDPQVTVSLCCAPSPDCAGLCHAAPCFWGGGALSCPLGVWGKDSFTSAELGLAGGGQGFFRLRSTSGTHSWKVGMPR